MYWRGEPSLLNSAVKFRDHAPSCQRSACQLDRFHALPHVDVLQASARGGQSAPVQCLLNTIIHIKLKIVSVIISTLAGTFLSGCLNLTPPASTAQSHGLLLAAKSSAQVKVSGPWLQMNHGILELAGSVAKQPGATTTSFSHLDILFYGNSGQVLKVMPVRFTPQSVGHARFASRRGYYSLKLEELPEGTALIEVQAHDADISGPHS